MRHSQDAWEIDDKGSSPVVDLTTLSESTLNYVSEYEESQKARAVVRASRIVNHSVVTMVGLMCQAEIENRVAILSQMNPRAARNLQELSIANMLYIRDHIYKRNGGRDY